MSDIVNSRELQTEINNRLDNLQKRIPRCKESKGAYFELQDLKQWVIDNQKANEANKQPNTEALPLHGVMPRSLMQEQLHLKTGSRTLNVRGVKNMDMPHVIISCVECWEPDSNDGFGEAEIDDASYYLTSDEIDKLIDKLREGKAFLNGA